MPRQLSLRSTSGERVAAGYERVVLGRGGDGHVCADHRVTDAHGMSDAATVVEFCGWCGEVLGEQPVGEVAAA